MHLARHHRRVALHHEAQEVLDSAVIHGRVEHDGSAVRPHAPLDLAVHVDRRGGQPRAHGVQVGVAVGAVHARLEVGVERKRAGSGVEGEVGRLGRARHEDLLEHAGEAAGGGERPADALDRAEIHLVEDVGAVHRGKAGVTGDPRAETAARVDDALRHRVREDGLEVERLVERDVAHQERRDREAPRLLRWVAWPQLDLGARRHQPLDQHRRRAGRPPLLRLGGRALAPASALLRSARPGGTRLRRYRHTQPLEPHVAHPPRPAEHVAPRGGSREPGYDDERRSVRHPAARKRQASPLDARPGQERHPQIAQAHLGIEPVGKRPLNPSPDVIVTGNERQRGADQQHQKDDRCASRPAQDRPAAGRQCGGHCFDCSTEGRCPAAGRNLDRPGRLGR